MSKELRRGIPADFKTSAVYKHAKKDAKSFRITQQLLQGVWSRAKRLKNLSVLILTIPANKKENYVLRCQVTKEKI